VSGTEVTDAEIIASSLDDAATFGALYERHLDVILAYYSRRVNASLARELTAETFCIAFEQRSKYLPEQPSALPWLFGIARNLRARHGRKVERQVRALHRLHARDPRECPDFTVTSNDAIDASNELRSIVRILARAPAREVEPLLLHVWEGLSYDEIAGTLGLPVGTVRSRISRARTSLARALRATPPTQVDSLPSKEFGHG
jgi:RNA polymerase sigma factor (sigma-70 family)